MKRHFQGTPSAVTRPSGSRNLKLQPTPKASDRTALTAYIAPSVSPRRYSPPLCSVWGTDDNGIVRFDDCAAQPPEYHVDALSLKFEAWPNIAPMNDTDGQTHPQNRSRDPLQSHKVCQSCKMTASAPTQPPDSTPSPQPPPARAATS